MTAKPVIPRALARRDADEAIDYYVDKVGADVAVRFVDALEKAYRLVSIRPATGSPRYAHELDLPGLRSHKLMGFPYLVFYLEREDHIDVWRVLHAQRDIPSWMTPTEN